MRCINGLLLYCEGLLRNSHQNRKFIQLVLFTSKAVKSYEFLLSFRSTANGLLCFKGTTGLCLNMSLTASIQSVSNISKVIKDILIIIKSINNLEDTFNHHYVHVESGLRKIIIMLVIDICVACFGHVDLVI